MVKNSHHKDFGNLAIILFSMSDIGQGADIDGSRWEVGTYMRFKLDPHNLFLSWKIHEEDRMVYR